MRLERKVVFEDFMPQVCMAFSLFSVSFSRGRVASRRDKRFGKSSSRSSILGKDNQFVVVGRFEIF
jgi:hypothetical protein